MNWLKQTKRSVHWPEGPLAGVLAVTGILNVLTGLSLPMSVLREFRTLDGLAESLSAIGGTAQVILGAFMLGAGVGLFFRNVSAWVISVFLLVIAVGVHAARDQWGPGVGLEAVMLVLLFVSRDRFTRRTVVASIVFSVGGMVAVLTYGLLGSYLLGKGFSPPIRDFGTAFYFTIVSLSTVGYGDIVPATPEARWFVVTLLIVGLGVFASAIASALGPKISREVGRLFHPKEKTMQPTDHVILVGDGVIALNTVQELKRRNLPFVQIVSDAKVAAAVSEHLVTGDATSDEVLIQAGIRQARTLIAARQDDGENAFIVLGAKELNPKVRVLAVASTALSIRRLKLARADLVFSPVAVGTRVLADLVEGSKIPDEFQDLLEGQK